MKALRVLFVALSVLMLASYIAVHLAGLEAFNIAKENSNVTEVGRLPLFLVMVGFYVHWPYGPWELFIALFALYSLLLGFLAFAGGSNVVTAAKRALTGDLKAMLDNAFWGTSIFSTASIVAMVALQKLQEPILPTGELKFPSLLDQFLSAAWAPIVEEVGFRLTVIGVIVVVACLGTTTTKEKLVAFLYPWKVRRKVGRLLDAAVEAGIVFTSVPFGLLHVLAGWGPGKATIAMLAGIVLGYLYARYSIAASIMGHWTYNYYTQTVSILAETGELVVGIPALMLVLYGTASLCFVAYIFLERMLVRPP